MKDDRCHLTANGDVFVISIIASEKGKVQTVVMQSRNLVCGHVKQCTMYILVLYSVNEQQVALAPDQHKKTTTPYTYANDTIYINK